METKPQKFRKRKEQEFDLDGENEDLLESNEEGEFSLATFPPHLISNLACTIFELGLKHSSPKILMNLMGNYPGLNTEHIKSHLQKYRIHHERSKDEFLSVFSDYFKETIAKGTWQQNDNDLNHTSDLEPTEDSEQNYLENGSSTAICLINSTVNSKSLKSPRYDNTSKPTSSSQLDQVQLDQLVSEWLSLTQQATIETKRASDSLITKFGDSHFIFSPQFQTFVPEFPSPFTPLPLQFSDSSQHFSFSSLVPPSSFSTSSTTSSHYTPLSTSYPPTNFTTTLPSFPPLNSTPTTSFPPLPVNSTLPFFPNSSSPPYMVPPSSYNTPSSMNPSIPLPSSSTSSLSSSSSSSSPPPPPPLSSHPFLQYKSYDTSRYPHSSFPLPPPQILMNENANQNQNLKNSPNRNNTGTILPPLTLPSHLQNENDSTSKENLGNSNQVEEGRGDDEGERERDVTVNELE